MAGNDRREDRGAGGTAPPGTGRQAGLPEPAPRLAPPKKSLRQICREIWAYVLTGFVLLLLVTAYGGRLEGRGQDRLTMRSPYAWILAAPVALFLYAAYRSVRYWRCPFCGTSLPTDSSGWRQENTCPGCSRRLDL